MAVYCQAAARGRSSTKKALLVGICYDNQTEGSEEFEPIPTSIPNVRKFKQFLQDYWGYTDITVMTDEDGVEENLQPTTHNLEREIKALSHGAKPGDRRVFYFSGHSDQLPCKTGSEEDGMDEALVALNGIKIRDNNLHKWLVKALPKGSALTAIFDCCHSGTLLDLPHHRCNSIYRPWVNKGKRASNTIHRYVVRKDCRYTRHGSQNLRRPSVGSGDQFPSLTWQAVHTMENSRPFVSWLGEDAGRHQRCASPERQFECDGWCRKTMQPGGSLPHADVISISSSNDGQISYDASTSNGDSLSMTSFLIGILKKDQKLTYSQLMMQLNHEVYSFTRGMHSSVQRRRSARRKARGKNRNPEGTEPEEDKGEMDNFQDLQLGSLTPLNMDRIFAL